MQTSHRAPRAIAIVSCLAFALTITAFAARPALAQVLYGSIVGTLTDETGAVVPKATVTVTNTATGLSRQATTDETGYYSIPNLQEGTYDLSVTASGFRPYTQKNIALPINSVTRVDAKIQVGAMNEEVTVQASAAILQTEKSDVSVSLDRALHPEPAALELPQLPGAVQSRAGHDAGAVSERRHRHAGTRPDDQRQRPGARREQHAGSMVRPTSW